jgi:2-dehydropantoate 2-reductase
MRLVIVGAGALGTLVAARLHHHGSDVTLVEPSAARRARIADGVAIRGFRRLDGPTAPPVVAAEALPADADAILLCVPAAAAAAAVASIAGRLPRHPPLLSLVGGLDGLELARAWPGETILGVTNLEVRTDDRGDPETGFHNFTWLGNLEATETDAMRALQHELAWLAPTLTTKVIAGMLWSKAIFELEAALPVLAGAAPRAFYDDDRHLDLAAELVGEGIAVALAHGPMPIAFDFFDPNLVPATTPGEVGTRRSWMRHCWQRHEQFRVGAPAPFSEPAGLGALLAPDHPDGELPLVVGQLRRAAGDGGVATPRLDALAAWLATAATHRPAIVAALEAAAP